jgi:plastocyanin
LGAELVAYNAVFGPFWRESRSETPTFGGVVPAAQASLCGAGRRISPAGDQPNRKFLDLKTQFSSFVLSFDLLQTRRTSEDETSVTLRNLISVRRLVPALAAAVLALPPALPAAAAPKVHTVIVDKMKFGPVPAGIRAGDTIIWVNRDFLKHTATARDKSFNVDLPPKSSRKTVIRHAGTIPFYCIYHPGMVGSLRVAR